MFAFIAKLLLAMGIGIVSKLFFTLTPENHEWLRQQNRERWIKIFPILNRGAYVVSACLVLWAIVGTSLVWIESGNIGIMKRIYFGKSLQPGHIVAMDGELGPQARIMTAGFHFESFVGLLYDIDEVQVTTIPPGKCAIMSAKDGLPAFSGSAFAAPWPEETRHKLINDATFFLGDGKGQRGPQTSCLMPGSYTINPFLWEEPKLINVTRVEQGTVGVVKSSVRANVDFGSFKRDAPADNTLKVLTAQLLPSESANVLLVPVGAIGVWEEALPNGLYYINTDAYKLTMVPTVAQVYEYKGCYTKRTVNVTIGDKGQIVDQKEDPQEIKMPESAADCAIMTKPEGWDVSQELRVLTQVSPLWAPYVVAALGLTEANAAQVIEDRVVTPIIRSVVRDVLGGAQIPFRYPEAIYEDVLDKDGKVIGSKPVLDVNGEPKTRMASEFRPVEVLDLLDQRASIEEAIEVRAEPEALKEGITVNEVRLAESAIPPELLIARKREQLAQQLKKAWEQEKKAQDQRKDTENARATADQQEDLVKAQIYAAQMEERAKGRQKEGQGEKDYMSSVAAGQELAVNAMGADNALKLQMFQNLLKTVTDLAKDSPAVFAALFNNAEKFVPATNVVVSGADGGLEGAAGIFGSLMRSPMPSTPAR